MLGKLTGSAALLIVICVLSAAALGTTAPAAPDTELAQVYVDGILRADCPYIGGEARMTLAGFAELMELPYDELTLDGVELSMGGGGLWIEAEGRCFYVEGGPAEIDGEAYLPIAILAEVAGCTTQWEAGTLSINIDATNPEPLTPGEDYYDAEDVYWLSRIIFSESGNQELCGMLGVGNVVLNRAASGAFPDSVYGVIFDRRFGTQFSPVQTGSIYAEPSELAVTAAKLCLEGCSVAGDSLYFVNPSTGVTRWFRSTRTFVERIGDHDFYS